MKRNKLTGWRDVYSFSLTQTMKGKSFLITTIIFCLVALFALPLSQLLGNDDAKKKQTITSIKMVYVVDESGLGITNYEELSKEKELKKLSFSVTNESVKSISKKLEKAKKDNKEVLLHIQMKDNAFAIELIRGANSGVDKDELERLGNHIKTFFETERMNTLSITDEQMASIQEPIEKEVLLLSEVDETGKSGAKPISMGQYSVLLSGICLLIFIIAFSGESIATSIITEKSNKVIEYLLMSVRPLAIIVGKILAALTVVITQFSLMGVCLIVSSLVIAPKLGVDSATISKAVRGIVDQDAMTAFSPLTIGLSIVVLLCGFLFYGMMAGLAGATVSRLEEMSEGLKVYNFIMIVGSYMGIALAIMKMSSGDAGLFEKIVLLLPISSPFVIPANLLMGTVSLGMVLASVGILVVSMVLLMFFVGRVYESMILHNGNRLKIGDLIGFAKNGKGAA